MFFSNLGMINFIPNECGSLSLIPHPTIRPQAYRHTHVTLFFLCTLISWWFLAESVFNLYIIFAILFEPQNGFWFRFLSCATLFSSFPLQLPFFFFQLYSFLCSYYQVISKLPGVDFLLVYSKHVQWWWNFNFIFFLRPFIICLKLGRYSLALLFQVISLFFFTIVLGISFTSPGDRSPIPWPPHLPLSWTHLHFLWNSLLVASWEQLCGKNIVFETLHVWTCLFFCSNLTVWLGIKL